MRRQNTKGPRRRRGRCMLCCVGLLGIVILVLLFAATSQNITTYVFSSLSLRGSFSQSWKETNSSILPSESTEATSLENEEKMLENGVTLGPSLNLVQAAFSEFCNDSPERKGNLPCSSRGLQRIRPILANSIIGLRIAPCGRGNVLSHLQMGTIVQHGAPHIYHVLSDAGKSIPICTYPAHMDKWVSKSIQDSGVWDASLSMFIVRTLTQPKQGTGIVIDIGANIGAMSVLAASLGYRVFAFEASRRSARLLARTVAINRLDKRITVLNNGLGDGLYVSKLVVPQDNRGGSALGLSKEHYGIDINRNAGTTLKEEHVSVVCLDTIVDYLDVILPTEGLPGVVTLMKIDVERLEPLVLKGGSVFFSRFDVKTVILEISSFGWKTIGCDVKQVVEAMLKIGYVMSTEDGMLVRSASEFDHWSKTIHLEKTQVNVVFTRMHNH